MEDVSSSAECVRRSVNFRVARTIFCPTTGAIAVREAVKRASVDPAQVDECIMGSVVPLV